MNARSYLNGFDDDMDFHPLFDDIRDIHITPPPPKSGAPTIKKGYTTAKIKSLILIIIL